jgi:hypothetical protein
MEASTASGESIFLPTVSVSMLLGFNAKTPRPKGAKVAGGNGARQTITA